MNPKLIKPLVISTIGSMGAGRETTMVMLAEVLYEEGYHCQSWDMKDNLYKLPWDSLTLIPKLEKVEHIKRLQDIGHDPILIRVTRPTLRDTDNGWYYNIKADWSINNCDSMRILKFNVKNLFLENIINSKKWK